MNDEELLGKVNARLALGDSASAVAVEVEINEKQLRECLNGRRKMGSHVRGRLLRWAMGAGPLSADEIRQLREMLEWWRSVADGQSLPLRKPSRQSARGSVQVTGQMVPPAYDNTPEKSKPARGKQDDARGAK